MANLGKLNNSQVVMEVGNIEVPYGDGNSEVATLDLILRRGSLSATVTVFIAREDVDRINKARLFLATAPDDLVS